MAKTTPKFDWYLRIISTVAIQLVLGSVGFLVAYWVLLRPDTAEEGSPNPVAPVSAYLFVGGLYALAGAVVQVVAHNRSDQEDYWGKQLVVGAASVALIGAARSVPDYLVTATISALVLAGIVVPVLTLVSRAVWQWLRHQPPGCSDARAW